MALTVMYIFIQLFIRCYMTYSVSVCSTPPPPPQPKQANTFTTKYVYLCLAYLLLSETCRSLIVVYTTSWFYGVNIQGGAFLKDL